MTCLIQELVTYLIPTNTKVFILHIQFSSEFQEYGVYSSRSELNKYIEMIGSEVNYTVIETYLDTIPKK